MEGKTKNHPGPGTGAQVAGDPMAFPGRRLLRPVFEHEMTVFHGSVPTPVPCDSELDS